MKCKILSFLVMSSVIATIAIGDTSYNGMSLETVLKQERAKKELNEKQIMPLQVSESFSVEDAIAKINNYSMENENSKLYSERQLLSNEETKLEEKDKNTSFSSQAEEQQQVLSSPQMNALIAGFEKYKAINSDTVGWIKIAGTNVDYPIMYNRDNSYYLTKNPYKDYSQAGSIFMDQQANGQWGIINLIHGHNMNNGTMFGNVADMMFEDYFNEHKIIQIYDGKTLKEYTAFAAFSLDDRIESIPVHYSSMDEYKAKIKDYQSRSRVVGNVPDNANDFVILNTCWYGDSGTEKNSHAIIVAYRSK